MATKNRLWVDTKAARTRDSYSPPMCDAKLAESAEARKRWSANALVHRWSVAESLRLGPQRARAQNGGGEISRADGWPQSSSSSPSLKNDMFHLSARETYEKYAIMSFMRPSPHSKIETSNKMLQNLPPCSDADSPYHQRRPAASDDCAETNPTLKRAH